MADQEERLSGALQENILTLLAFDDAHCKIIRGAVSPQLFESSVYREVAGHAIDFIDQYDEAIKDHLPDHLEDILKGEDARKASTYKKLIDNLYQSKDSVNAQYVISQLNRFVRMQRLKSGLVEAVEAARDGRVDEAELAMQRALKSQVVAFEAGLNLADPAALASIFDKPDEDGFELGIPEFDKLGIHPKRKELLALLAPRKRGKSWFITHCAKQALLQRWRVVIVTLELLEKPYGGRMLQAFFSISRQSGMQRITQLVRGKDGALDGLVQEEVQRINMKDPATRAKILPRAKREFGRRGLRIKEYPSNCLTLPELEAYLDQLERFEGFVPDLICVDYPRLMKLDSGNLRVELGQTIASIRGVCQKRNAAGVIVHQTNRPSESASTVTADMVEEDISILASVDAAITFSQTKAEKRMGLARLCAEVVRNAPSHTTVLITQAYGVGQFCLDSMRIGEEYWDIVKDKGEEAGRRRARRPDSEEEVE
jgi:hypothetical protein